MLTDTKDRAVLQQEELTTRHRGELSSDPFDPNVPVPIVRNGHFERTTDVVREYLRQLLVLGDPRVHGDRKQFTQHVYDSFVFLDFHWEKLLKDLYNGTLTPGVAVSTNVRQAYLEVVKPRPKESLQVEKWLRELGFHRRRFAAEAGYDLNLFHGTDPEDLPLVLESAVMDEESAKKMRAKDSKVMGTLEAVVEENTSTTSSSSPLGLDTFSFAATGKHATMTFDSLTSPPHGLGLSPKASRSSADISPSRSFHIPKLSFTERRSGRHALRSGRSSLSSGRYSKRSKYSIKNRTVLCEGTPTDALFSNFLPSRLPWRVDNNNENNINEAK